MTLPQAMRPSGFLGRPFGWIMERLNRTAYHQVLDILAPDKGQSLLEIGFGTGAFLELYSDEVCPSKIVAMDPSDLMVHRVKRRMNKFPNTTSDIFIGDDTSLEKIDDKFDYVVAIHSF